MKEKITWQFQHSVPHRYAQTPWLCEDYSLKWLCEFGTITDCDMLRATPFSTRVQRLFKERQQREKRGKKASHRQQVLTIRLYGLLPIMTVLGGTAKKLPETSEGCVAFISGDMLKFRIFFPEAEVPNIRCTPGHPVVPVIDNANTQLARFFLVLWVYFVFKPNTCGSYMRIIISSNYIHWWYSVHLDTIES